MLMPEMQILDQIKDWTGSTARPSVPVLGGGPEVLLGVLDHLGPLEAPLVLLLDLPPVLLLALGVLPLGVGKTVVAAILHQLGVNFGQILQKENIFGFIS